jgi:hypothetical protein
VYYECDRSVYMTSTPRGWNVSHAIPLTLRNVNLRRTPVFVVDYYGDSLTDYIAVHRPGYVSIQWTW